MIYKVPTFGTNNHSDPVRQFLATLGSPKAVIYFGEEYAIVKTEEVATDTLLADFSATSEVLEDGIIEGFKVEYVDEPFTEVSGE